jgi:NitT/TauT family transport system ATP-binding protein
MAGNQPKLVDHPRSAAAATPAKIAAHHVEKYYRARGGIFQAIRDFNLEIGDGEFLCLVGPSGCGKSTFLRMVGGLATPSGGEIRIIAGDGDRPVSSIVFQEYALFPWKTVRENVAFGLQMRGVAKAERHAVADHWLGKVGLRRFADSYPRQLSGGMRQRVSIARAFATDPEVLLMDEPLGALDAQTRIILQQELIALWEQHRKTVLYVTHSLEEAVLLGDRVVLMTACPGTVKAAFEIAFPRPRQHDLTGTREFAEVTLMIWKSLQEEVMRSMEAQQ